MEQGIFAGVVFLAISVVLALIVRMIRHDAKADLINQINRASDKSKIRILDLQGTIRKSYEHKINEMPDDWDSLRRVQSTESPDK